MLDNIKGLKIPDIKLPGGMKIPDVKLPDMNPFGKKEPAKP